MPAPRSPFKPSREGPHPSEYIDLETLLDPPFGDPDVDDGGVEDVEIDRLPGDGEEL